MRLVSGNFGMGGGQQMGGPPARGAPAAMRPQTPSRFANPRERMAVLAKIHKKFPQMAVQAAQANALRGV